MTKLAFIGNRGPGKRVLVNAVSAKSGGARTIVEGFIEFARSQTGTAFIVVAGFSRPSELPAHIVWKYKPLNGIRAVLYNLLFIVRDFQKYRCSEVLSFNNMNCILLPTERKKTYFHQLKALDNSFREIKLACIRIYLRSSNELVIVQSPMVKRAFIDMFQTRHPVMVVWPGVSVAPSDNHEIVDHKVVLVPVANPKSPHKNFIFVKRTAEALGSEWTVLVTADRPTEPTNNPCNIKYIGRQPRESLFRYYRTCECVLFASTHETIGLPIFEALAVDTPVVAFGAPYIRSLRDKFDIRSGLALVDTTLEASQQINQIASMNRSIRYTHDFKESEWDIAFHRANRKIA